MSPDDERHGSVAGYIAKCREECCRAAWRKYRKQANGRAYIARGPLTVGALGTHRRLQALVAIGYSLGELDGLLGMKTSYCSYLLSRKQIHRTNADRVAALYERYSGTPKVGWRADSQRKIARGRGWLSPLAWDNIDDPNERPTATRDHSHYRAAELASEWNHLRLSGESIEQAARQLGVSVGAIEKAIERAGRDAA